MRVAPALSSARAFRLCVSRIEARGPRARAGVRSHTQSPDQTIHASYITIKSDSNSKTRCKPGYTAWFVYRYLLFKDSREELVKDVEDLKKKITGGDL